MRHANAGRNISELDRLCTDVRAFVTAGAYEACYEPICRAMEQYPHAPQPHNLMGIILEKTGDHLTAMKHFRAAWALDPTYLPANHNLNTYGTFYASGSCAFDESDVPTAPARRVTIAYNERGVGHIVRR